MLEEELFGIIKGEGVNLLVTAGGKVVERCKSFHDWKKVFIDTGKFFIEHERYAEPIFDNLPDVLSKENMVELAKELKGEDGYRLKNRLLGKLLEMLDKYDIPHDIAYSYACGILNTILEQLREIAPQKYDRYFQQEWKEEQAAALKDISEKINRVHNELQKYRENKIQIFSADEMDMQLRKKTINPKIGISFFTIDDEVFRKDFNFHRNDECMYIRGRSQEETLYCIINELWQLGDNRTVFVVESYEDWEKLRLISSDGNIYIPRFYRDEIVAIEGNTNIFIFPESLPVIAHNALTIRPRTYSTISHALHQAGMDMEKANKLVAETHGLYVPMKKKIFNGLDLKAPDWIQGLPEQVKKTCLLIGQWTEAEGDKAVIESLSGIEYGAFRQQILPYTRGEEPLIHIYRENSSPVYCLASVENTWDYMRISVDDSFWKCFSEILIEVLNEAENLFVYSVNERMLAQFKGEKLFWSGEIRNGMIRTLIMKAFYCSDEDCRRDMDLLVERILGYVKTEEQWKYISAFFVNLCEVSPKAVLKRLEAEWSNPTGLINIFKDQTDNFFFGRNEYINVLWGVEEFLVQQEYASRAFKWLLQLDDLSFGYKSNSPKDTLSKIFCTWYNFSAFQSVEDKKKMAETAISMNRNGWDYIYDALPGNHNSILGQLNTPKYRPYSNMNEVGVADLNLIVEAYVRILLRHMDFLPERWEKLLKFCGKLNGTLENEIFDTLRFELSQMTDFEILQIKGSIRDIVYRHRYFASAAWSMDEQKVIQFEELLGQIHTRESEYEYIYLFEREYNFPLLHPVPYNQEGAHEANEKSRTILVREKIREFQECKCCLETLIKGCANRASNNLGKYLAVYWNKGEMDFGIFEMLIENQKSGDMALDYLWFISKWSKALFTNCLKVSKKLNCDEGVVARMYRVEAEKTSDLPLIDGAEENIKRLFWGEYHVCSERNTEWTLAECKKYGTIQSYLELLYRVQEQLRLSPEKLLECLIDIEKMRRTQNFEMVEYYMEKLLKPLQDRFIKNREKCTRIAVIEMIFLHVLDWPQMICFREAIKRSPEMFAEMVSAIFRHKGEDARKLSEEESNFKDNMYALYEKAKFCPAEENSKVDLQKLEKWTRQFKTLLERANQDELYGYLMGRLFAYSPTGEDGHKPCEAVRLMIEADDNESMLREYETTVYNGRGIFTPDAGKSERRMAKEFRENADYFSMRYPRTAEIYYNLARRYEWESKREREDAENGWH